MISYEIFLKSIVDIKNFVNVVNTYDFDIDLESGRYTIDAKSIMGIMGLGLDVDKVITVEAEGEDEAEAILAIEDFLTR